MFKHAIYISKQAMYLGQHISVDEQTIGCQGRHPDITRISYKHKGDGFQCDAVCSDGYTYTFYFRNHPAPQVFLDLQMSPLHAHVNALSISYLVRIMYARWIIYISLQEWLALHGNQNKR